MRVCLCKQQVRPAHSQSQHLSQIRQWVYWCSGSVPIWVWSMCYVTIPFHGFVSISSIPALWCCSWWIRWTIVVTSVCFTIFCFISRMRSSFVDVLIIFFVSPAFIILILYSLSLTLYHLFARLVLFLPFIHEPVLVMLPMCYFVVLVYLWFELPRYTSSCSWRVRQ